MTGDHCDGDCRVATWVFRVSRRGGCRVSRGGGGGEVEVDGAVGDVKDGNPLDAERVLCWVEAERFSSTLSGAERVGCMQWLGGFLCQSIASA